MNIQPNFQNSLFTNLNKGLLIVSQINFFIQSILSLESMTSLLTKQGQELTDDISKAVPTGTFPENAPTATAETEAVSALETPDLTIDDLNADYWSQ
jgi:hypothetical protein